MICYLRKWQFSPICQKLIELIPGLAIEIPIFTPVKKLFIILLLFFYSAATIGATVNMHYCMNKFAGYSLSNIKKDKCGKCGMKTSKKNGCCKDEKKQIKLSSDQQKSNLTSSTHFNYTPAVIHSFINNIVPNNEPVLFLSSYNATPPLIPKQGLQAFYAIFLI